MSEVIARFRRFTPNSLRSVKTANMQQVRLKQRSDSFTQKAPPATPEIDLALVQTALGFDPSAADDVLTSSNLPLTSYSDDDEEDETSSSEDEDLLLAELEKIKKERSLQQALDEKAASVPLFPSKTVQKHSFLESESHVRWDEDCMFTKVDEPPHKKVAVEDEYVDVIRSEFHKSFLKQFVK
ncbi:hypothetical protein RCL1_001521 [Eukaryota sp. TZLM3-RCL]